MPFRGRVGIFSAPVISDPSLPGTAAYAVNQLGFKATNGDPSMLSLNNTATSGTLYVTRLVAAQTFTLGTISYGTAVGNGSTATAPIATIATGASNIVNGSGNTSPANGASFTLTTATTSGYPASGAFAVGSFTGAYSAWSGTSMTVIAGSYPVNTAISTGATINDLKNGFVVFNSSGNPIGVTVDQGSNTNFTGTGGKQTTVPQATVITAESVVYVGFLQVMTSGTAAKMQGFNSSAAIASLAAAGGLTGANIRFAANGTGLTSMPATITPSSNVTTGANCYWLGLS